jgi:hypothetical protein
MGQQHNKYPNLNHKIPSLLQKKLDSSDSERQLKCPILDVFSALGVSIELIPFAMRQTSRETSLNYPQHILIILKPLVDPYSI